MVSWAIELILKTLSYWGHPLVSLAIELILKTLRHHQIVNLASFKWIEACGQLVLPDSSILIGEKLVENAKIEKLKWYILCDFQTLCTRQSSVKFDIFLKTWKSTKWGHVLMQHPVVKKVVWAAQAEKSVCFLYVLCDYRWCP